MATAHEREVESLRLQAEGLQRDHTPAGLIIVERLDEFPRADDPAHREHEMSVALRALKRLAKDLDTSVIALMSVDPSADERLPPRPRIHDLTAAAAVERFADTVLFVYRPDYYLLGDSPIEWQGKAEIIIAVSPDGERGSMVAGYLDRYGLFVNLTR